MFDAQRRPAMRNRPAAQRAEASLISRSAAHCIATSIAQMADRKSSAVASGCRFSSAFISLAGTCRSSTSVLATAEKKRG